MPISISGDGSIAGLVPGGLPDASVTTADLANNAVTTAKLGSGEASGLCKAWVNFNGTGTVAIRASYNVSSITDNGVGDYTVNFTTAMVDANYTVAMQGPGAITGTTWFLIPGFVNNAGSSTPTTKTTTAVRYCLYNPFASNPDNYDAVDCGVAIFR